MIQLDCEDFTMKYKQHCKCKNNYNSTVLSASLLRNKIEHFTPQQRREMNEILYQNSVKARL